MLVEMLQKEEESSPSSAKHPLRISRNSRLRHTNTAAPRVSSSRANESRQMLVEIVQKEEAGPSEAKPVDDELPDDDDEAAELESFDLWKLREVGRVSQLI